MDILHAALWRQSRTLSRDILSTRPPEPTSPQVRLALAVLLVAALLGSFELVAGYFCELAAVSSHPTTGKDH